MPTWAWLGPLIGVAVVAGAAALGAGALGLIRSMEERDPDSARNREADEPYRRKGAP
jgi:hypothetical protein